MLFEQVDIIVTPTSGKQLVATNLTGHPAIILPNGFRGSDAPLPPKVGNIRGMKITSVAPALRFRSPSSPATTRMKSWPRSHTLTRKRRGSTSFTPSWGEAVVSDQ